METARVYWGQIGIMEKNMQTTVVRWGYIGIVEKKMEDTIVHWDYIGFRVMWNDSLSRLFVP